MCPIVFLLGACVLITYPHLLFKKTLIPSAYGTVSKGSLNIDNGLYTFKENNFLACFVACITMPA